MAAARGRHTGKSSTTVVRHRTLDVIDIVEHRQLKVTAKPLTVLDASTQVGISVIDSALLTRAVTLDTLSAAHQRYPKRHGAPQVARYLTLLGNGARSEAERLAVTIFRNAGLTGWIANHPACGYVIDFAFVAQMVAVEIDGFAHHRDAAAFQHDRTRRNGLIAAGWTILNFTWSDLIDRPDQVISIVCAELRRRACRSGCCVTRIPGNSATSSPQTYREVTPITASRNSGRQITRSGM